MSGSTGIAYRVISAEELLRRETEAARARVEARRSAVHVLRAAVGPTVVAAIPATRVGSLQRADLDRLAKLETALVAEEQAISAASDRERASRARDALTAELETLRVELPTLRFRGTGDRTERRTAGPEALLARRLQAVLDVAAGLEDSVRGDLQRLAAVVSDSGAGSAKALSFLTEMEAKVTAAVNRQRERESHLRRVRELGYEFAALLSSETQEGVRARALYGSLGDQPGLGGAAQRLRDLDLSRTQAADRRYALEQAASVLLEMGYAVDLEPDGSNGELIATASSQTWPNHGLKLVFPAERPGLHTAPVAFSDTDARDDLAFEKLSCGDVDRLRDGLRSRGVPTDVTYQTPPGRLAVQHQTKTTVRKPITVTARKQKR